MKIFLSYSTSCLSRPVKHKILKHILKS
ncbi:hypothetical protein AMTRI_Chr07g80910 [Amborella trichopoda]